MKLVKIIKRVMYKKFFVFEAQKMLEVRSKKIGLIYRACQLFVVVYIAAYVMYFESGYQIKEKAVSGVSAKIKGIAYSKMPGIPPALGDKVWDAADYVIPPQLNSAFFIMTRSIETDNQTHSFCDEAVDIVAAQCYNDSDCEPGKIVMIGNGVMTGKCIKSSQKADHKVCEIYGWCPTEKDGIPYDRNIMKQAENYTVLLKNSIEFPRFRTKRKNILEWMNRSYIYGCRFNPNDSTDKFCPILKLGDIVKLAEGENKKIWASGGMISININWDCNLDFDSKYCLPEYSFRHLEDSSSKVGQGVSFRHAHYHQRQGIEYRTLVKSYGILFFISVTGTARKFDLYTFSMNLGSSVGLLSLASGVGEAMAMYLLRRLDLYKHPRADLKRRKIVSVKDWRHQRVNRKMLIAKKRNHDKSSLNSADVRICEEGNVND